MLTPLAPAFIGCLCIGPFGLVAIALMVVWIMTIIDVVNNEPASDPDRLMWLLIVILAGSVGALIYYFIRRPERIKKYGR